MNIHFTPISQSSIFEIRPIKMKENNNLYTKKGPENLIPDPKYVISILFLFFSSCKRFTFFFRCSR